MGKHP